jgi:hypothetical protein
MLSSAARATSHPPDGPRVPPGPSMCELRLPSGRLRTLEPLVHWAEALKGLVQRFNPLATPAIATTSACSL